MCSVQEVSHDNPDLGERMNHAVMNVERLERENLPGRNERFLLI